MSWVSCKRTVVTLQDTSLEVKPTIGKERKGRRWPKNGCTIPDLERRDHKQTPQQLCLVHLALEPDSTAPQSFDTSLATCVRVKDLSSNLRQPPQVMSSGLRKTVQGTSTQQNRRHKARRFLTTNIVYQPKTFISLILTLANKSPGLRSIPPQVRERSRAQPSLNPGAFDPKNMANSKIMKTSSNQPS